MSEADRQKWDAKYAKCESPRACAPDAWLVECVDRLMASFGASTVFRDFSEPASDAPHGAWTAPAAARVPRALDVACGLGHNAVWLASRGWRVTAVDISSVGLERARRAAEGRSVAVRWVCADLDSWEPPVEQFELVVVFRFWDRRILPRLIERALVPGGAVVLESFSRRQLLRPDTHIHNPDFTIDVAELPAFFGGLEVLVCREVDLPDRSVVRLLGRRRER
ncbi:MAG: class I SAM-dependent methyltransferase [Planctomycetota bacterium]|nr:MAG: class I SAM-dependent methyltransferase [Planctomycetota bacterium]